MSSEYFYILNFVLNNLFGYENKTSDSKYD